MQTTTTPVQSNTLLAGAILEEYRDLLDVPEPLEAAAKKKKHTHLSCPPCATPTPTCNTQKPTPKPKPKKKALSWNDLPRA